MTEPLPSRTTRQRRAIEDAISRAGRPLTPAEVLDSARPTSPTLSLATVYRTLRLLRDAGMVVAVEMPGSPPRYEPSDLSHHHHFKCDRCDRVFDIDGCPGDLSPMLPAGFTLSGHELLLTGTCASCTGTHP